MKVSLQSKKLKALACAAVASMAVGAAHAGGPDYIFEKGGALLSFTEESLDALATAGVTIAPVAPATFDGSKINLTSNNDLVNWDSTHNVTSLTGLGGFQLTSSTRPGAKVDLSNVTLDTATGTIYADAVTSSFTTRTSSYTGQTINHMALFTGSLIGDTVIQLDSTGKGQVNTTLKDLKLTAVSIPTLGDALGVPGSIQRAVFPALNFGEVKLTGIFAPVPEPSAWALMAIGLIGVSAVANRRRQSV